MRNFYNRHAGETALLVGNGPNLKQTPPEWFGYPSFGMNTVHRYEGWIPTYYTAVDARVEREFGREIATKYADIPKFIPWPNLDHWQGDNFYRFYHSPEPFPPIDAGRLRNPDMPDIGLTYGNIMHIALQLAAWMGFETILMIGVEHKPSEAREHFWGFDAGMSEFAPVADWLKGYKEIAAKLAGMGIRVLNISQDTYVPEDVLPRGDWKDWRNHEIKNA